jgi:hypothetical protein
MCVYIAVSGEPRADLRTIYSSRAAVPGSISHGQQYAIVMRVDTGVNRLV